MASFVFKTKKLFEMTEPGRFCIDWEDFKSTASDRFRDLIGKKDFSDVTLVAADGARIPSHQVILASGCSFFRILLEEESTPKPLIFMRGVDSNILQPLITFLYTGGAEVREELLVDFMALTEDLGVDGLANPNKTSGEEKESLKEDDKRNFTGISDDFEYESGVAKENHGETMIQDAKSDILKFCCDICKRYFNIEANFNKHKLVHEKGGKRLISGGTTNNHKGPFKVLLPEIDADGFYPCNHCDKRISDRSNFRRHFQRDHLKIQQKCDECDYTSTDPVSLRFHSKKRHNKSNSIGDIKPILANE